MADNTPNYWAGDAAAQSLAASVLGQLSFDPTPEQMLLIAGLSKFLLHSPEKGVFLLNGYAGTGKTSVTGALVRAMSLSGMKCVLLAPTGRAAHVLAEYAGHPAYTIHRKIYRQRSYASEIYGLAENKHTNTLFLVDEASMISNTVSEMTHFGSGRLLDDLISYVYSGEGCRLLLMGDDAQLPPVGQLQSPALNPQLLQSYGLIVYQMTLRQTVRQAQESGILHNATMLRCAMEEQELVAPQLQLDGHDDMVSVAGDMVLETISDCYDSDGLADTIIITRSNRRATRFNAGIRASILYREELLASGDLLLVAKNNYYWAEEYEQIDFIANGDVARVVRVKGETERRYGLQFATITVELPEHDNLEMDVKVVLDCLMSDTPALTREQQERLFQEVYAELPGDKRTKYRELKRHPYFNALQVKFAYAVTCHKAQGGQWNNVLIDMGGIAPEAMTTLDFYRWLYTALTRARRRVYLI